MADQNIISYINAATSKGDQKPQIEQALLKAGWSKDQVSEAFGAVQNSKKVENLEITVIKNEELIDYKSIAIFLGVFDFFTFFRARELFSMLSSLNYCQTANCVNSAFQSIISFNIFILLLVIALPGFIVLTLVNKSLKIAFLYFLISGLIILVSDLVYTSSHFYLSHILNNIFPVGLGFANLPLFFFIILSFFLISFKLLGRTLKISQLQDKFFTILLLIFFLYTFLSFVAPLSFYKLNSKIFAPINNYLYLQIRKSEIKQNNTTYPQIPNTNNYSPNNY